MKSNNLSSVDSQLEMPLSRRPERSVLPIELIAKQQSFMGAIALCIAQSGLEDKEIYIPLEIDPGHWTRMRKGDAHFPLNKIGSLMDLCNNDIPLQWLAFNRGFELKPLLSTLEQQLAEAKAVAQEREKENEILRSLLKR